MSTDGHTRSAKLITESTQPNRQLAPWEYRDTRVLPSQWIPPKHYTWSIHKQKKQTLSGKDTETRAPWPSTNLRYLHTSLYESSKLRPLRKSYSVSDIEEDAIGRFIRRDSGIRRKVGDESVLMGTECLSTRFTGP